MTLTYEFDGKETILEISNAELTIALVNIIIENYDLKGQVGRLFNDLDLDNDYLLDLVNEEEIKDYFYDDAYADHLDKLDYWDYPKTI